MWRTSRLTTKLLISFALSLGVVGEISGPKHKGEQTNLIDLEVITKKKNTQMFCYEKTKT